MTTVYLALGSNVGDSRQYIELAVELLGARLSDIRRAPLYLSEAVGYTDQANFINTALRGRTDLSPQELLNFVKDIERRVGRTPTFHYGPREIDIDIILYGDLVLDIGAGTALEASGSESGAGPLVIPHPEFSRRDFVLRPLCDLNPSLVDPVGGQTVEELLRQIGPNQKSVLTTVDENC